MTSTIHDLGYKRYAGTRGSASQRWRVIMRHQIAMGWRTWWRYKLALAGAFATTIVGAVLLFVLGRTGMIGDVGGQPATIIAFGWYYRCAFVASLTLGAGVIASDMQSGAFVFYFARSIRPIDYMAGKLAGYGALICGLVVVGPVLMALMQIGMSGASDLKTIVPMLALVPKALGVGLMTALAMTALPLGFSALTANRRYALALWAAYYIIFGVIVGGIGMALFDKAFLAIDLGVAFQTLAIHAFGATAPAILPPVWAAVVSILGQSGIAILIVYVQLTTAQKAGVGGAT